MKTEVEVLSPVKPDAIQKLEALEAPAGQKTLVVVTDPATLAKMMGNETPAIPTPTHDNKHPLAGLPVASVAKMFRAILKHYKYGMTHDERLEFANIIIHQSHCANGTAAQIGEILKKKA